MPSLVHTARMDTDVYELVRSVMKGCDISRLNILNDELFDDNNGRFVSMNCGGRLIALSYHTRKMHSATCEVYIIANGWSLQNKIVRSARTEAPPGRWAVAYCDSGRVGCERSYYSCS